MKNKKLTIHNKTLWKPGNFILTEEEYNYQINTNPSIKEYIRRILQK